LKQYVQSDACLLRRKATRHYQRCLTHKVVGALSKKTQKTKFIDSIAKQTLLKIKKNYLGEWIVALKCKQHERKARQVIKQLRKRQVLARLDLFVRLAREKSLKLTAAKAFSHLWTERAVLTHLVEFVRDSRWQNKVLAGRLCEFEQRRVSKVFRAWQGVASRRV
jgi:hypothetical protein